MTPSRTKSPDASGPSTAGCPGGRPGRSLGIRPGTPVECDWIASTVPCEVCDGEGVLSWLGTCWGCGGSGTQEYEGPPSYALIP